MWASKLPFVEFGINTTMHVSMGKSSYKLVFKVQPQLSVDIMLGSDQRLSPQSREFVQHCRLLIDGAHTAMEQAQQQQKYQYDKRHYNIEFVVADLVMLSMHNLYMPSNCKFAAHFIGPFKMLNLIDQFAYCIELPPIYSALQNVFHVFKLKLYVPGGGDGTSTNIQLVIIDSEAV